MLQTITTTYHGARNVRGSRCIARSTSGKSAVVEWDDALSSDANHVAAARALATKLGWRGTFAMGTLKGGAVIHVCLDTAADRWAL